MDSLESAILGRDDELSQEILSAIDQKRRQLSDEDKPGEGKPDESKKSS
jgi:hypothetical protein